jgi:hypothetical protein
MSAASTKCPKERGGMMELDDEGVGLDFGDDPVHVDLYVFESPQLAAEVARGEPRGTDGTTYAVAGTNGRLMIVGAVDISGDEGRRRKYALAAVASAFGGRE